MEVILPFYNILYPYLTFGNPFRSDQGSALKRVQFSPTLRYFLLSKPYELGIAHAAIDALYHNLPPTTILLLGLVALSLSQ